MDIFCVSFLKHFIIDMKAQINFLVKTDKTYYQLELNQTEEDKNLRLEESKQSVQLSIAYIGKCAAKVKI